MTKYELVGRIMSLGAESSGKLPSSKMYARDESVKLLNEYLEICCDSGEGTGQIVP
jgi:hypothetical protein